MQTALWIVNGCLIVLIFVLTRNLQRLKKTTQTSEEQYQIIFETVTDGLIINTRDGTIVEANVAACKMHGYKRDGLIGQNAAELVHPDYMHLYREYIEALSAGQAFQCVARNLRKDGSALDVEVNGIPFVFNGTPHLLAIIRDVTQRKQMFDALQYSEELNRSIVEAVPAGIVHVAKHGAILNANARAQSFLGLSRDELTRQYVRDFQSTSIYEDGTECDPKDFPVSQCLKTGGKHGPLTLGVSRPDGSRAWAMFVAVPLNDPETHEQVGAIVTFLDITARKQVEQELLESEERFRLLAENVPGVIYLCLNDDRYTMLYINDAVEELTGYSKQEFLAEGVSFVDLYHPDDKMAVVAEANRALSERRPYRLHYRVIHRSGEVRWVHEVGAGVWRENALVYLEGFLDDVTDRVRSEQALQTAQRALINQQQKENERVRAELERVQDHLVQSTRLATIGKMAAQIAHEIRNPLGTIKNATFYARRKMPDSERRAHENLELVQREVAVCVDIIENILSITKIQPPRKSVLELGPFVAEAFRRLRDNDLNRQDPHQLSCIYESDPQPLFVEVDYVQFRQVLDNLLKNAMEAMQGSGEIRVVARQSRYGTRIEVSDTGPGVPADQAETIFDLFQTTKPKGTGLGLGISRQITERHGGTLTLKRPDTNDKPGACFIIELPAGNSMPTIS